MAFRFVAANQSRKGKLLGQRRHGNPLRAAQGRAHSRHSPRVKEAAKDEVIDLLAFYNRTRMHYTLGYVAPMKFEELWHRNQSLIAA